MEGKIAKKRKYHEEKNVDRENKSGGGIEFPADPEQNVREEEIAAENDKPVQVKARRKQKPPSNELAEAKFASEEYKTFLEEKAKSAFESLFGNLRMVLSGTKKPLETSELIGGGSETDIREGFSRLRSAIRSIPSSIEDDFRKEFEENRRNSEKVKVSNCEPAEVSSKIQANLRPVLSGEKEPIETGPSLEDGKKRETILKPISSEQSNQSIGGKTVTTYFCPVSESCKFILTKVITSFVHPEVLSCLFLL